MPEKTGKPGKPGKKRENREKNREKNGKPFFLDINSVSPGRKQETAKLFGDAARYLDVAVLAPIHPARHRTPMLLAGPHAQAVAPVLAALGMRVSVAGAEIGAAASIKMVRSVMIKGIEALTLECFLAAARAGVVDEVAASMRNNYPGLDWAKVVPYNLERMAMHGERRAAEMEFGPTRIIHIYRPSLALKAIAVVDNTACGAAVGGVRMAPDVSVAECFRLARAMTPLTPSMSAFAPTRGRCWKKAGATRRCRAPQLWR